jgi:hypothetical protein
MFESKLSQGWPQIVRNILVQDRPLPGLPFGEICSNPFAMHDVAALCEGNLSQLGKYRLAIHLTRCQACRTALASLYGNARPHVDRAPGHASSSATALSRRRLACQVYLGTTAPLLRSGRNVVLVLAVDPSRTSAVKLEEECTEIRRRLDSTPNYDGLRVEARWSTSAQDLKRHVDELDPTIVHFTGHGGCGNAMLANDRGKLGAVPAHALAVAIAGTRRRLVVLSGCHSAALASTLRATAACVVGLPQDIGAEDARSFTVAFYGALGYRHPVEKAVEQAVAWLNARRHSEMHVPICWTRDDVDTVRLTLPPLESGGTSPPECMTTRRSLPARGRCPQGTWRGAITGFAAARPPCLP